MKVLRVTGLPPEPLAAATGFHQRLPVTDSDLAIQFNHAGPEHRGWRLAVVQNLARAAAPHRVNAVVGDDGAGMGEVLAYLAAAPGITGQLFELDGALPPQHLD